VQLSDRCEAAITKNILCLCLGDRELVDDDDDAPESVDDAEEGRRLDDADEYVGVKVDSFDDDLQEGRRLEDTDEYVGVKVDSFDDDLLLRNEGSLQEPFELCRDSVSGSVIVQDKPLLIFAAATLPP